MPDSRSTPHAEGLPLFGLRVLDLTRLIPGPYATMVLADLGAQVDKLEDPKGGDYLRQTPPHRGDTSALFYALNRNKRSLALDLKSPAAAAAMLKLVTRYDVLVESFRPGVLDKLGFGWDHLHAANPRLILCSISGFGQTGPERGRAGHDLTYQAKAGVLGYGGPSDGPPGHPGVQIADTGGGAFALVGILAALYERERTGRGRRIDLSLSESALAFLHAPLSARLLMGQGAQPLGRGAELLNGGVPCYAIYGTKDGRSLAVGALEPKFWSGVCEVLERPDLASSGWGRTEPAGRIRAEVQAIFLKRTAAEWLERFKGKDLCVELVYEGDDVLADPQLQARAFIARGADVERGWSDVPHLRTPVRLGDPPLRPAPELGQHTLEILREAGLTEDEIRALQ